MNNSKWLTSKNIEPPKNNLRMLHEVVSDDYTLGDFNEFFGRMGNPENRKLFYDTLTDPETGEYNLGNYNEFENHVVSAAEELVGKKKKALFDVEEFKRDTMRELGILTEDELVAEEPTVTPEPTITPEPVVAPVVEEPVVPEIEPTDAVPTIRAERRPELYQAIKDIIWKPFVKTPEERRAKAQNIYNVAKETGLDIKTVADSYKNLTKELGLKQRPDTMELLGGLMIMPITAGIATHPFATLLGLAGFEVISEIENAIVSLSPEIKYKFHAGKEIADLLPEEVNEQTKSVVQVLDFVGKGLILGGIYKKSPAIVEKFTKNIIENYKLPKTVRISPAKIKNMFTGKGEKVAEYEADLVKSLGLDSKQYKTASQKGIEIDVPTTKIIKIVDKPYWASIKKVFGIEPYEKITYEKGVLGYKELPKGLLEEKAGVRAEPIKPVVEPKVEVKPEVPVKPTKEPTKPKFDDTKLNELSRTEYEKPFTELKKAEQKTVLKGKQFVVPYSEEMDKSLKPGTIDSIMPDKTRPAMMVDANKEYFTDGHWLIKDEVANTLRDTYYKKNPDMVKYRDEEKSITFENVIPDLEKRKPAHKQAITLSDVRNSMVFSDGETQVAVNIDYYKHMKKLLPDTEDFIAKGDYNNFLVMMEGEEFKGLIIPLKDIETGVPADYKVGVAPTVPKVEKVAPEKPVEAEKEVKVEEPAKGEITEPHPTEAQIEAGNYKKRKIAWNGLTISIENEANTFREGIDKSGKPWKQKIHYDYGYINRTEAKDGDQIDIFMGPNLEAPTVFVVNQIDQKTGKFDEHKVMAGFDTKEEAIAGYLKNYEKGWKVGEVIEMSIDEFKEWAKEGKQLKPAKEEVVPEVKVTPEPKPLPEKKPEAKVEAEKPKEVKEVVKTEPEATTEDTYMNMGIPLVMPDVVQKKINVIKKIFKEPVGINKKAWDIVKDYWGSRAGLEFKYSNKWNKTLRAKVPIEGKKTILRIQKFKDKFSSDELEDAIFYRQKTGNIWKGKEDTFENVAERMPEELKDFVDGEVDEHISNWRKLWNASPFTKDIDAREEVIKTYLTGVYSGNIKKGYEYLVGLKGRSFVLKNFMLNKKMYLNFEEAFRKGGLVPRFRNIADQLNYQDAHMIRLLANNELIGRIHKLEKEINSKLIVRANSKLYDDAKLAKDEDGNANYIPFDDPWLRSYVAGKKPDGSLIWSTTKAPALVYRDLADAVQSVFNKDAYKPENILLRTYDRAGSFLRYIRVTFSGFHFVPLAESFVGGKGTGVLNIPKWVKHGKKLLDDPVFMEEMKEAGLRFKAPSEVSRSQIEGSIQKIINVLEAQGIEKKIIGKTIKYITAPQFRLTKFLFDEYLPLLKTQMYYDYKHKALSLAEKKGIKHDTEQMKELNRSIASIVNDQFGGQSWEMIRVLNDPKVMKWMHRLVGYPDWSISALRQAGAIGESGIRGTLSRRYWLRYGIAFMAIQTALSYLFTGMYNDKDDENKIKWSMDKAHSTFKNIDPSLKHKIDFQLPDIEIDIPLIGMFNPGRELREDGTYGRRYYSHFGKQMLEIPRYALNFTEQMFAKSNPVIQIVLKQIFGGTPYKGGIFPARGGYSVTGEYESWKGKKGLERWRERAIQIVQDATPFSIQSMWTTSPATAGLLPISKATSLFAAKDYIEKALRKDDANELLNIVQSLLDSGYEVKSIKRNITLIAKNILREKETKAIKQETIKPIGYKKEQKEYKLPKLRETGITKQRRFELPQMRNK